MAATTEFTIGWTPAVPMGRGQVIWVGSTRWPTLSPTWASSRRTGRAWAAWSPSTWSTGTPTRARGRPVRARRGPSPRGPRARMDVDGLGAGGGLLRVATTTPPPTSAEHRHGRTDPEHGGAARRGAPRLQPSHRRTSPVAAGRQRSGDLIGWVQPGGSRTRQPLWPPKPNELESTGLGSQGRGLPCTTWIVISGSGSS